MWLEHNLIHEKHKQRKMILMNCENGAQKKEKKF